MIIHFLSVNFVYLDTRYHSDLTSQEKEEVLCYMLRNTCRMLSKFTFEKEIETFAIEINLHKVKWMLLCSHNPRFCNLQLHFNAIDKAIEFYYKTYDKI